MREKPALPESVDEIPAWFMTYSDVITLLMTFFILLLTFSTNEPEMFEKIQIALFGGGAASGITGPPPKGPDKDSWVLRIRPRLSRYAQRGTETAPLLHSPTREAVNKGLEVVEDSRFDPTTSHAILVPIAHLLSSKGEVAAGHVVHIKRLSRILGQQPVQLTLEISNESHLERVLLFVKNLIEDRGVEAARISVSLVDPAKLGQDGLRLVVNRTEVR